MQQEKEGQKAPQTQKRFEGAPIVITLKLDGEAKGRLLEAAQSNNVMVDIQYSKDEDKFRIVISGDDEYLNALRESVLRSEADMKSKENGDLYR